MAALLGELPQPLDPFEILRGENFRAEPGIAAAARRQRLPWTILPSEQAALQREVGNECETEAYAFRNDRRLRFAIEQSVVVLYAGESPGDGSKLFRGEVGAADLPYFARTDQLLHRAERVLVRR